MSNISSLDLNLLKALNVLLEEENVSRAAEQLYITQPTMSASLNKLRERFGDPLFVRALHGMIPTNKALQLKQPVQEILWRIERLVQSDDVNPLYGCNNMTRAC